ncbi:hypothetical protein H257_17204 [Aphanomyces astaci]|uniref:Uncharacterized protein n=1 Tax=Aphanomyces astaci TaxID=112090 RepID=W4FHJ7_APHAT|nr:hypothetical protein H257_17204 [Aphanomyces astaci]ETV66301.1 hypothetical protein H257_17204 [Aphanomyces astaci]|eukprot:XP_009844207.1 hypothetical protein H257_17204 [Aphanomyces astaci]
MAATQRHHDEWFDANFIDHRRSGSFGHSTSVADTFRAVHDTFEHENKVAREERDLNFNDNVASNADNFDGMDYQTADDDGLSSDNITAYISVLTNSRNYFSRVPDQHCQGVHISDRVLDGSKAIRRLLRTFSGRNVSKHDKSPIKTMPLVEHTNLKELLVGTLTVAYLSDFVEYLLGSAGVSGLCDPLWADFVYDLSCTSVVPG